MNKQDEIPAVVLVADDNDANRQLAKHALEDEGHRVVLAGDGEQALAACERQHVDCVVLDVRMPGLDGFAVSARLRALGNDTPIIFLTALRDVDTFDRAIEAGADDFLTKPVNPAELAVRVQAALKLRRLRIELREHYDLLRHQRDALMRIQLQKERLTSFLVHDLKNPVNAIDMLAQLLERTKDAPPSVYERAGKIRATARTLTRMILNLLDISKSDEGRLAPRWSTIDPRALLETVVSEVDAAARERQVELRVTADIPSLDGDHDLLRRALINLTENAIRHAPSRSSVSLSVVDAQEGVEFRVVDGGSGVPDDMKEKIFDPFVQVEAGEETLVTRTGRGLGLSFCKAAADAHGGRIWVANAEPGAAFSMRIGKPRSL